MAEWKIKKERIEKTEDDEESEEKEDIETEEAEEQEELSKEESENGEEEAEEEKESFRISRVDFSGIRAESLESEVEETREGEGESEGRESFEDFASPMSVREIAAPVLASAPMSSATGGIEGEVGGITEAQSSRERREQAARTPIADYTAGAYERNYWIDERENTRRDADRIIVPVRQRREIQEGTERDIRSIDFSAWQRSMEAQEPRRRETLPAAAEEYVVRAERHEQKRRMPFELKEEKRKYRP